MRVLIVPTEIERRPVRRALLAAAPWAPEDGLDWRVGDLLVVESGVGPAAMAAMLPRLDALAPAAVWLFGWCGGLAADLAVGDLALADATVLRAGDGAVTRIAHPPPEALVAQVRRVAQALGVRLAVGPVLTSDRVLATVADKQAGAGTGAVAVEMEAGPLARWAAARGTPFVHLRVVLDPLRSALPSERLHGDEEDGDGEWAFFARALLHPRDWGAVWRLVRQVRLARRAMTRTIAGLAGPGGPLAAGDL